MFLRKFIIDLKIAQSDDVRIPNPSLIIGDKKTSFV